jgi:AAA domain
VRLEQLDVAGFGRLTGVDITFHPRVTVIFGDNESGKSTLQRAIRAALYGVDAGGQGRAVDKSEWSRWKPWTHAKYGVALTYSLDDGRRLRIARRLDTREQSVQVVELGGHEVTDELRIGRVVAPGRFHLGIDETVFCATAWLGEDGLRLASSEAAAQRATELQEAVERIADPGGGVTAAQAVVLLRQALDRVGSERRMSSPLGVATVRLRDLDAALHEARGRVAAVAGEQERLRRLDATAAEADERRLSAERAWLTGRLADLAHRRRQLEAAGAEATAYAEAIDATKPFAAFRTDDEERVIALGAELNQTMLAAAETAKRWEATEPGRQTVRRRRAEIAAGMRALTPVTAPVNIDEAAVRDLHAALGAAAASWARLDTSAVVQERRAALLREIAATGFGDLPPESVEALAPLLAGAATRPRLPRWIAAAWLLPVVGVAAGMLLAIRHLPVASAGVLVAACAAALMLGAGIRQSRGAAKTERRRQLVALRVSGVDSAELDRLSERLPSLQALRAALLREQALAESRRLDAEALQHEASVVYSRCAAAAASCGLAPATPPAKPTTADVYIDSARDLLVRVDAALTAQQRRAELIAEDRQLAMTEVALAHVMDEMERCKKAVADGTRRLQGILTGAGIAGPKSPAEGVVAFRQACAERRRHDEAVRAADEVRRRMGVLGADSQMLQRSWEHFAAELRSRGGLPDAADEAAPLDAEALRRLETDAEHAKREAAIAGTEARALRARLSTLLDAVPDLADLEDERSACAAARERGLRQVAALQKAIELIELATRGAHRELAPRLAESLHERLSLLTDSRYQQVNVDTDHFAVSLLCGDRPDFVPLELASQGTRDQVSLLLRLALCEVLSGSGETSPLLLDEPLLTSDSDRRRASLEFLHGLSTTHQVVVTTSSPALAEELRDIAGDGECRLVHLGGEGTVEAVGRLLQSSPAMRTSPSSSETSSVNNGIRATGTSPRRSSLAS